MSLGLGLGLDVGVGSREGVEACAAVVSLNIGILEREQIIPKVTTFAVLRPLRELGRTNEPIVPALACLMVFLARRKEKLLPRRRKIH